MCLIAKQGAIEAQVSRICLMGQCPAIDQLRQ